MIFHIIHYCGRKVRARAKSGPASIVCAGLSASDAMDALQATLTKGRGCDGLFAVTDSLAVGAYQFFRQQGLRIPDDVAVVGVGDHELADFFNPPLTTTAGANDAMVAEAVPLLFSQLLDRKKTQPQEILVAPPVYVRDSTRRKGVREG
jgi:LacI family transcriptional regulator